ncbi:MAG TPA: presqualene diphosphate synthase HpnD [Vicinamibacterales bacterium]|nr:presqualene diphosphate synthase HpnD [Vicinamibacterales bacterium]
MGRDTSFYYSFLVLPAEKRKAIVAVWDFCRAVDDAVDEAPAGTHEVRVREWREELTRCFDGGEPRTQQGRGLQPLIAPFHLPRAAFDALIEGVEMDLHTSRYATFADLYEYCIRVASAVGLMCIEIFGCRDPASKQYAIDLGVALQLTNILRDVPGDLERGRVYIPLKDFARFGCHEGDLGAEAIHAGHGVRSTAVKQLLAFQAQRARDYYRRADTILPRTDARRLVAARIMGAIYRGILDRIEAADYDVFSEVIRVPRPRRALIAAATWARTAITGR